MSQPTLKQCHNHLTKVLKAKNHLRKAIFAAKNAGVLIQPDSIFKELSTPLNTIDEMVREYSKESLAAAQYLELLRKANK